jgi:hypothetical protein
MKVYHGTTLAAQKKIIAEHEIHPSHSSIESSIDTLLIWAQQAGSVGELPKMGQMSQPSALGDGVYAFKDYDDAYSYRSEHCAVTIELNDSVEIMNLDSRHEIQRLAWKLLSTDYQAVFKKRAYEEEIRNQFIKLFALLAEFLVGVADGDASVEDYPYVFAYALWLLDKIFGAKLSVVARTFTGEPTYICIHDNNAIRTITT